MDHYRGVRSADFEKLLPAVLEGIVATFGLKLPQRATAGPPQRDGPATGTGRQLGGVGLLEAPLSVASRR